jgi:hypothetical protein
MISKIKILEFKHKHYGMLLSMLDDRETEWIQHISYKTLPKIGYIVVFGKHPIAAGFLRRLEGGYGQLDTFVTSPHFGSMFRDGALNLIVDRLLDDAKSLDLLGIMAITKDEGIISRAKERGFNTIPQVLLGLDLSRR